MSLNLLSRQFRRERENGKHFLIACVFAAQVISGWRDISVLVIAHEDSLTTGFGAEVAARIAENCIDVLEAPMLRVAARDSFVPSAPALEAMILPSAGDLPIAVEQVLHY